MMTPADKETLLDILWRAMSAAAKHEDIPVEAERIADEMIRILDFLIEQSPQDDD